MTSAKPAWLPLRPALAAVHVYISLGKKIPHHPHYGTLSAASASNAHAGHPRHAYAGGQSAWIRTIRSAAQVGAGSDQVDRHVVL